MVTGFLRGGLGNQMFEYAAGLRLAKKKNTTLALDSVHLSDRFPRKNFTYRVYDMDIFNIEPRFTILSKIANTLPIPGIWLGLDLLLIGLRDVLGIQKMLQEKSERFDPAVLAAGGKKFLFCRGATRKKFFSILGVFTSAYPFPP